MFSSTAKSVFILLFIQLSAGCTKYAEYEESDGRLALSISDAEIESVKVIDWQLDANPRQVLSRGVEIRVTLPRMDSNLMEKLYDEYKADSWGVRVMRTSMSRSDNIAELYVPVISVTESDRIRSRSQSPRSMTFRLFYAASAISQRLSNLECPAFNHRNKIDRTSVESLDRDHTIYASRFKRDRGQRNIREVGYFPVTINGGRSLQGRYEVELGLYNSRDNVFISDFRPISHQVRIHNETAISVPECDGFKVPDRTPEDSDPMRDFQFGR